MRSLIEKYTMHKKRYMKNLQFDPQLENLSKFFFLPTYFTDSFPAALIEHAPLEAVYIQINTATYDQIERDVKVGQMIQSMVSSELPSHFHHDHNHQVK